MSAVITSPTDIINLALGKIGYKLRIGSLYDGSLAAKKALDIYGQTRDQLLRARDWNFAEKIAAAVLSGQPAPAPWSIEYTYPADCIRLRAMFNADYLSDRNNPKPVLWAVAHSDSANEKVVWANVTAATLVYTEQVTNPAQWEPLFVESLAFELAQRLSAGLSGPDAAKILMEEDKETMGAVEAVIE